MKLEGINISNLRTYRNKFTLENLEKVWKNIDNGVFLKFQKALEKQEKKNRQEEDAKKKVSVTKEIIRMLEAYEEKGGLSALISDFFADGKWNLSGMEKKLEPLSSESLTNDRNCFYSRNEQEIKKFINRRGESWDDKKAGLFYLFLLCLLQAKPREEIMEEEFAFIGGKLDLIKEERGYMAEGRMGMDTGLDMNIYPYGSGFLFLKDGKIMNEKKDLISPVLEKIICFAYTEDLGLIAFTQQGTPSACMEPDTRYEIEERRKGIDAENKKVVMAAASGNIYLLLLENGNILTNVQDSLEGWRDIRWVGTGLNSITAITGNTGSLLELGSDAGLHDFSGVRAAYTWSGDGERKYAVLKENGDFMTDDGSREKDVDAAYIDAGGYLYAVGPKIYLQHFGEERKLMAMTEPDCTIVALCRRHSKVGARGISGTGKEFFTIKDEREFR